MTLTPEIVYNLTALTLAPMMERCAGREVHAVQRAIYLEVRDAWQQRWPIGDVRWEELCGRVRTSYFYGLDFPAGNAARAGRVSVYSSYAIYAVEQATLGRPAELMAQAVDLATACRANGINLRLPYLDTGILKEIAAKRLILDMGTFHGGDVGGTTHCRAGATILRVGPVAIELGKYFGSGRVARAIYASSHPGEPLPDLHTDEATAVADMKRRAEFEPRRARR